MDSDHQPGATGLYIHWPYCEAKCPYCDFNSHVSRQIDQADWQAAYLSELRRVARETRDKTVVSVYFGGGTPSLMHPSTVHAILTEVARLWPRSNTLEVTLEANPGSVEAGRFEGFRDAGVNRVSLGVQALNDDDLRALGRIHSTSEARSALDIAQKHFDRVSFDLIYARQDQSLKDWTAELNRAIALGTSHLSLYQLTIEPGTAFGDRHARGTLRGLPDEDLGADMFAATQEICGAHALPAYEVSNHARPGHESRHNTLYWTYRDYIGIGPGAHGRITIDGQKYATETYLEPKSWLAHVNSGSGECHRSPITLAIQAEEYLMMSIRTTEGTDLARFAALSGTPIDGKKLAHLSDLGLILQSRGRVSATLSGRAVLNAIIRDLLVA